MESWSANPISSNFVVDVFLDTNLLKFLVDGTYNNLKCFVDLASCSDFMNLISSKFVLFEFMGVRRRDHYIKHASSILISRGCNPQSTINCDDTRQLFYTPGIEYNDIKANIEQDIERDVDNIVNDFGISFEYSKINDNQLDLSLELLCKARISKEDCLVLSSAILTEPDKFADNLLLLTKDKEFVSEYNENSDVKGLLVSKNIPVPQLHRITDIKINDVVSISLTDKRNKTRLISQINEFILNLIIKRNIDSYLGTTITPVKGTLPMNIIPFKFDSTKEAPENFYITIISKDLKFLYNFFDKIQFLEHAHTPFKKGDRLVEGKNYVAFKATEFNITEQKDIDILKEIKTQGNIVFITPDS